MGHVVTDQLVDDYRRDGAVVVRGAFSAADLAAAEAGIEAVRAARGAPAGLLALAVGDAEAGGEVP